MFTSLQRAPAKGFLSSSTTKARLALEISHQIKVALQRCLDPARQALSPKPSSNSSYSNIQKRTSLQDLGFVKGYVFICENYQGNLGYWQYMYNVYCSLLQLTIIYFPFFSTQTGKTRQDSNKVLINRLRITILYLV